MHHLVLTKDRYELYGCNILTPKQKDLKILPWPPINNSVLWVCFRKFAFGIHCLIYLTGMFKLSKEICITLMITSPINSDSNRLLWYDECFVIFKSCLRIDCRIFHESLLLRFCIWVIMIKRWRDFLRKSKKQRSIPIMVIDFLQLCKRK